MAFRKLGPAAGLTTGADVDLSTVSLGAPYARLFGFQAANWASSAKAAEGTDTAQRIRIKDATGRVVFLDAADRDYGATSGPTGSAANSGTTIMFGQDETVTGIGDIHTDATGAALSSQAGLKGAIVKSPVTVGVVNGGTATDYVEVFLYVEV